MNDYANMEPPKAPLKTKLRQFVSDFFWGMLFFALGIYATFELSPSLGYAPAVEEQTAESVVRDMQKVRHIYAEHGKNLTPKEAPFVLSLPDALARLYASTGVNGWGEVLKGEPWRGTEIFLIGQHDRLMITLVSDDTCDKIAHLSGQPIKELSDMPSGLSYMAKQSAVDIPSCYRQRWSGSANSLFASLYFGTTSEYMVGNVAFQRLKPSALLSVPAENTKDTREPELQAISL